MKLSLEQKEDVNRVIFRQLYSLEQKIKHSLLNHNYILKEQVSKEIMGREKTITQAIYRAMDKSHIPIK